MNLFIITNKTLCLHPYASIFFLILLTTLLLSETYVLLRFHSNGSKQNESLPSLRKPFYKKLVSTIVVCMVLSDLLHLPLLVLLPMLWLALEIYVFSSVPFQLPLEKKLKNIHDIRVTTIFMAVFATLVVGLGVFTILFVVSYIIS